MAHPAIYTLPCSYVASLLILKTVTKSQKVDISSHDELQKVHNISLAWHRFRGFLREGVVKQEFPISPVTFLKNNQKLFPWNLRVDIPY